MKNKLDIQWFIEQHADWEKLLSEKPYCLEIKRDKMFGRNLILFKYNMIETSWAEGGNIVRECRGLVLDEDTLESVVVPFYKFFNEGEFYADKIDWNTAKVTQKLDGCVSHDTLIKTTAGDIKIEDICKNPNMYEVLTFNHENNKIEANRIEAVDIKPNINNWYEIELENGKILKVTGNHRIWCENLQCYRRVDELDGTEDLKVI